MLGWFLIRRVVTYTDATFLQLCSPRFSRKQNKVAFITTTKRKVSSLRIIRSVLNNRKSSISDNGASEPARILLERLFAQTQKLEEQMNRNSHHRQDIQLGFNLEILESDLHAALAALKKKEEDLRDAERTVFFEHCELHRTKEELEQREKEIAAASCRYEKIGEELKQANLRLASQARHIDDIKLRLRERDQEIAAAQAALSLKEEELDKMRNELLLKSEEATKTESELKCKSHLLNEANEVVERQAVEVQGLRKSLQEKEEELEVSQMQRTLEVEKLKVAEEKLEKQTMEWLLAQEELKKLAEEASRHAGETNETLEDYRRVKKLLADVRSELVSSQKSLASSRQKMEEQEKLLETQWGELEEHKGSVMTYLTTLKDAQIEVQSERAKLRVAEAKKKELERDLSMEKELMEELQELLKKERYSLHQAINGISSLQKKLDKKNADFGKMCDLLRVKESVMVEAKLEIQHLKSERDSLKLILDEKDFELLNARNKLEEVNNEIAELKMLLNSKEDQLIQATTMLKEKDEHVNTMQNELNDTKLKYSEAETVVGRIVELTNKLVISIKDDDSSTPRMFDDMGQDLLQQLLENPADDFRLRIKQLETELELARDSLRTKEMEVLASQRALTIKDEELKMVLGGLDAKEKEVKKMKEEAKDANDLRKLYALAQERLEEKSIGDLAIEKLQIEAAQLEVEAATNALHKLAEMSGEFLHKASLSIEADAYTTIFLPNGSDPSRSVAENNECLTEVTTEVSRISALTDQLVKEAGIVVRAEPAGQ